MGNREIKGFLSAVYSWGLARDLVTGITTNPCHNVKRNTETAREHYIQDWEYQLAIKHSPKWLANVIHLAYLLYTRINEVLSLQNEHILPEGIYVTRQKGSKDNIVKWSKQLRAVISACIINQQQSPYICVRDNGKKITYSMIRKPLKKVMDECVNERPDFTPFTLYDLKRKGMTDQDIDQNSRS